MFGAVTKVSEHVPVSGFILVLKSILTLTEMPDTALEGSSLTIIKTDESFHCFLRGATLDPNFTGCRYNTLTQGKEKSLSSPSVFALEMRIDQRKCLGL